MSFIRLTKNKKIDEILVQISRLIATLTPTYDYTEEGETTSYFNQLKKVMYEMVNDEVKKNKKNIPELKKTLLFFLNEDFKVSIEEALKEGKLRYDAKLLPDKENIETIIDGIREQYLQELENAERMYRIEVSREAQQAEKTLSAIEMKKWNPKEFNEMDYVEIRKLYEKFNEAVKLYEQLKGKKYRKGIKINKEKEEAEKAIRQDKEEARRIRDELIAKQREERRIRDEISALQKAEREAKKPKKSRRQIEQEKYGITGTTPGNILPLEDIDKTLISYSVPSKVRKGLFNDIKDLVVSIIEEEKKIEGLQPQYPEKEGNRDRTGKLLTQEEVDRLIRVRERLAQKKIPKNEVIEEEKVELEEPEFIEDTEIKPLKKRRGRPPNPNSKRQQKIKGPVKEEEIIKPAPKKRGPKPNPESKRQKELAKKRGDVNLDTPITPTSEPKKRGRPKKAPEEKSRPPPKKEGVGRPKRCDEVKPKLDNKQPYGLREDKKIITKADIFSIPFETKKGTRYEVNYRLLMNINATPPRFLNVVDKILEKSNLKIDNERTKPTRKSFLEELESLSSSGRKRATTYRKITQYLIAKGITTAYDLEHNLTQEILNDLNEKEDSSKLVAFEKYVEKNCIDKPKSETQQEVKPKEKQPKQPKQARQAQKDPDVTFNYMLENIDKYSNEFKKAEQPTPKTILKIVSDIWSKPANNTLRFKDGNIEAFITETDENDNVLGNVYDQRPIKSVVSAIITAITEKYDIPDLYAYVKNKENKSKLSDDIIEKLTELLDKVGGRLLKKNEPVPRRYK